MISPKATIIMATYNRAHFIEETLYSIQNQTFSDWECLIIDDGGTDNTQELITPILEKDSRFRFLKRPETYLKGLPGCRNYGLDLAKGEFVIFFDDDDVMHPLNMELCVKELENPDYFFCRYLRIGFIGNFNYEFDLTIGYNSFLIDVKDIEAVLKNIIPFNSCAVMWRKDCFENNRFVEHLMYAEEWELYSRILSNGVKGISIDKVLFFGRKHPDSNTGEFFNNNPIRKKSKVDAILLVVENLKNKGLLSEDLLRYFIQMAPKFKRFKLFKNIVKIVKISIRERLKWYLYYGYYALRLYLYRLKTRIKL